MVALAHAVPASTGLALRIENLSHGFALDGQHPVLRLWSGPPDMVAATGKLRQLRCR